MELLAEFLVFVAKFALCYFALSIVIGMFVKKPAKDVKQEKQELIEKVTKLIHRIKQEQHGECYYWFDADSDQFLAQGHTDEEIRKHLLSRFKGHIFLIDNEKAMAGPELQVTPISELTLDPQ